MHPESAPDPGFRESVEMVIAEDRPAVMVSLLPVEDEAGDRMEIALTDGTDRLAAADLLEYAAVRLRDGAV